jgi:hypothetical protein
MRLLAAEEFAMPTAALTPRVRMMVICDHVRESRSEVGVFDLKGVRQRATVDVVPFTTDRLSLFFLLSSPRAGEFPGYVRVVSDRTDRVVYYSYLRPRPEFADGGGTCTGRVALRCIFPEEGQYTVQLWFFQHEGADVLKGEIPFQVLKHEAST